MKVFGSQQEQGFTLGHNIQSGTGRIQSSVQCVPWTFSTEFKQLKREAESSFSTGTHIRNTWGFVCMCVRWVIPQGTSENLPLPYQKAAIQQIPGL
jgi:hypothetical protein